MTQSIRDPFRLMRDSERLAPSMGHEFDPKLNCRCGKSWSKHQTTAKVCPRVQGEISRWMSDPVRGELERWLKSENSRISHRKSELDKRQRNLEAMNRRLMQLKEMLDERKLEQQCHRCRAELKPE